MKSGQGVTGNIFKRLFNYFNTKRYEKKAVKKEYIDGVKSMKWLIRGGKAATLAGAVYLAEYWSRVDNVVQVNLRQDYLSLMQEISSEVERCVSSPTTDFKTFFKELMNQLENYFSFEVYEGENSINLTQEGKILNQIYKQLGGDNNSSDNLKIIKVNKLLTPEEYSTEAKEIRQKLKYYKIFT
jgi:hypothetical protein